MSAEQFGTNLRATAAISIPNLVRGCLPLILVLFHFFQSSIAKTASDNYVTAAWMTGIVIMVIGFTSVIFTRETFGKEMDFIEE